MINKIFFGLTFAAVGALAYGWYYNNQRILDTQRVQIEKFISAGPRFTAHDGHDLCEVVKVIAQHSIGYQRSKLELPDCDKYLHIFK